MKTSLYNNDGTLSSQAQSLLSSRPDDMSRAEWRKRIKEFRSQLSEKDAKDFNRLKANAQKTAYRKKNKEKTKVWNKKFNKKYDYKDYYQKNKEERRAYQRAHYKKNKEKKRIWKAEYERNRRQKDPLYNFFHSIRSQAVRVVKQVGLGKKPTNTFKWVGCSPEELKAHIESLFQEGMTWDNYGRYGWHVDHIRPVSSFKPEDWEQINHYTNLQPLWWQDNLSKSDNPQY